MSLDNLVCKREIFDLMQEKEGFAKEIRQAYARYLDCDWGEMSAEDKRMNDIAVANGNDRILAAYFTSEGKIYIITEWDRSVTTILFANEY